MSRVTRQGIVAFLVVLLTAVGARAQTASAPVKAARDNYDSGVKAFKAQNWAAAVTALTAAIDTDRIARTYKDGVQSSDYYPQLYLFMVYAAQKDWVNAKKYYNMRGSLTPQLVSLARPSVDAMNAEDKRVADLKAAED